MNTNKLYLEYARVIELCKGTALEDSPWKCVKFKENKESPFEGHPQLKNTGYTFAAAILDDKPVFVGDVLYSKVDGEAYKVELLTVSTELVSLLVWQPPQPKRTFNLNGVELPCPIEDSCIRLDFLGIEYYFQSLADRNLVAKTINDVLQLAKSLNNE